MSGLLATIQDGIRSATYNPQADAAMKAEKAEIKAEKDIFRQQLISYRDTKDALLKKKEASPWFLYWGDKAINDGLAYIQETTHGVDDIKAQEDIVKTQWNQFGQGNQVFNGFSQFKPMILANLDQQVTQKKMTVSQKGQFLSVINNIESELNKAANNPGSYTFEYGLQRGQSYGKQFEQLQKEIAGGPHVDVSSPPSPEEVSQAQRNAADANTAAMATFSVKRMISDIFATAGNVVGAFIFVVFFLIGGTLCANDAIGRPISYRILYFIYGGIFFPITIIYYIYRWFMGTAPNIYRMIPVFTTNAESTLGRFFLYPFTYTKDKAEFDAYVKYMTDAATLVGKKFTPPAFVETGPQLEAMKEALEKIAVTGVPAASPGFAPSKEQTGAILTALSGLKVSK